MALPYKKLDKPLNDIALLCRGCLAESGEMKNVYEWGLDGDFCQLTNIKISKDDGISLLLCKTCEDSLLKCKEFKQQCDEANKVLLGIWEKRCQKELPATVIDDIFYTQNTVSSQIYNEKIVIVIQAPDMLQKIYLPCPYSECREKFQKRKHLIGHLIKKHNITFKDIEMKYFCSLRGCNYEYHDENSKYFTERKFLNQHYNKVHKERIFQCGNCTQSYSTQTELSRHERTCKTIYLCEVCNIQYKCHERLLVHLMRKHPDLHKQYKTKRKAKTPEIETKKTKLDSDRLNEYFCDSPRRSLATQTTNLEDNIKNDVSLASCQSTPGKTDVYGIKTDEISTQTVFEDLLSLKSQNSEDDSMFFSETASLIDIQTQTFPIEFGLSRSNKETITSETQSPDLSMKETQTCFCHFESPRAAARFDSVTAGPSGHLMCTETQTSFDEPVTDSL